VIGTNTFYQGSATDPSSISNGDYWLVKDVSNLRDSVQARDGIEITAAMASAINSVVFPVNYSFNDIPLMTQQIIDQHKQIGQDPLVHLAKYRYFRINLVIIYTDGFSVASTNAFISQQINRWFSNYQIFGGIIEPSSILQVAYGVNGVNTARFALSSDNDASGNLLAVGAYGIEEVDQYGNNIQNFDGTKPIILEDNELPIFYDLGPNGPLQRTVSTWV
jgi:hypothetical protein